MMQQKCTHYFAWPRPHFSLSDDGCAESADDALGDKGDAGTEPGKAGFKIIESADDTSGSAKSGRAKYSKTAKFLTCPHTKGTRYSRAILYHSVSLGSSKFSLLVQLIVIYKIPKNKEHKLCSTIDTKLLAWVGNCIHAQ